MEESHCEIIFAAAFFHFWGLIVVLFGKYWHICAEKYPIYL